eukprot:NODE_316_length_1647_cov_94.836842_g284_i0.p1 GENE.NODE_316_length_1647_cov_94.836842_g284_i0~~NODE_316_length_1647_cov_94.836842_g284_i0.p1  ORF type:complete len:501 (-),score=94.67 NODE_316_length_1647_cov_94.836842_g284_i0:77-1579(-)
MDVCETIRLLHEDVERYQQEIMDEYEVEPKTQKHRMIHDHFIADRIKSIQGKREMLSQYYDSDAYVTVSSHEPTVDEALANFYDRLTEIRSAHRGTSRATARVPKPAARAKPNPNSLTVQFTAEEFYGKYLDLNESHQEYCNLPFNYEDPSAPPTKRARKNPKAGQDESKEAAAAFGGALQTAKAMANFRPIDYRMFLERLGMFHTVALRHKNMQYLNFLQGMREYLKGFVKRVEPLHDMSLLAEGVAPEFERKWAAKIAPGWEELPGYDELERDPKPAQGNKLTKKQRQLVFWKKVALVEAIISKYLEGLESVVTATKEHCIKKLSRTRAEVEQELEQEDEETYRAFQQLKEARAAAANKLIEEEEDDEDEEPKMNNPLDLPLGWDGKPIPYWLYKLHGLGVTYTCDICGSRQRGPRAHERHFQEFRHTSALRNLGIPNTRHFLFVTSPADALALWEKMKYDTTSRHWQEEREMEYEDAEGNVFNKRTFEDMKRSGMLI